MALALQEAITVICRVRSARQVASDSQQFRNHLRGLLGQADAEARQMGYAGNDVKLAIYAFVALLDESVLQSPQAIFKDWAGRPFQEELFEDHLAGENFFKHLSELMQRPDSANLADLLEVRQLCLLLGFKGRYGGGDGTALAGIIAGLGDRIQRIRGSKGFGDGWAIPEASFPPVKDPWIRRLGFAASGGLVCSLLLWLIYRAGLGSAAEQLANLL